LDDEGQERWRFEFDPPTPVSANPTAPLLAEDGVMAFTSGNRVFALQTPMTPADSGWAMHRADPQRSGHVTPAVRIMSLAPTTEGGWELKVAGLRGTSCSVEESVDLMSWSPVTTVLVVSPTLTVPLPAPGDSSPRFYRVSVRP
jgi:hypothetical protein